MKRRVCTLLLAGALLLGLTPAGFAFDRQDQIAFYKDVTVKDWFYDEVMTLSAKGIVEGTGDGKYSPKAKVARGQALKMVLLTVGTEIQKDPAGTGKWYDDYLYTARQLGAVDETFAQQVGGEITRLETAELIAALSGLEAKELEQAPFADNQESAVALLYAYGITTGAKGADGKQYFHGEETLSRCELAAFVVRLLRVVQTERARELASYYNIPADIAWVDQPVTRQDFVDDILIEYLCGEYDNVFFYDDVKSVETMAKVMNASVSGPKADTVYMWWDIFNNHPDIAGFNSNVDSWLETSAKQQMLVFRVEGAQLDEPTLYKQQMDALKFAKDLSRKLRDQGKIKDSMTQKEIAQVYYKWLQNFGVKVPGRSEPGGHNVHYDSAYAVLVSKEAACVGRAAAFSLLMGVEKIPSRGVACKGHVMNYLVLDDEEYLADWGNHIPITKLSSYKERFEPLPHSLEYAQESCKRLSCTAE